MRRTRLLLALAGVALALLAVLLARPGRAPLAQQLSIGGPFTLTDGAGQRVTEATYAGDWRLVYFGYTHCPDVCPTTLSNLAAALDRLPPAGRAHLRVLFITVDPARDTQKLVGEYAHAFGPEFTGLTGTQAELDRVEAEYRVYARRHALNNGDYAMDHSSIIYVMAPDGHYVGLLDDSMAPADLATHLRDFGV